MLAVRHGAETLPSPLDDLVGVERALLLDAVSEPGGRAVRALRFGPLPS
jgi:hypothetical protein